ncbi:hypothetical protein MJT46_019063 [Ovis ammon polii x Ovis aries]|nr:hypothetical protein MJT46_019063 [Ovis ammon polii x Ovis aries]
MSLLLPSVDNGNYSNLRGKPCEFTGSKKMQSASASNTARNSATNPPPLSDSVPHNCIPFGSSTKVTAQFEITEKTRKVRSLSTACQGQGSRAYALGDLSWEGAMEPPGLGREGKGNACLHEIFKQRIKKTTGKWEMTSGQVFGLLNPGCLWDPTHSPGENTDLQEAAHRPTRRQHRSGEEWNAAAELKLLILTAEIAQL